MTPLVGGRRPSKNIPHSAAKIGRRHWRLLRFCALAAIVAAHSLAPRAAAAATTLRIATLAPKGSTWGKLYGTWAIALEKRTNGAITVQTLWNGVGGASSAMIPKLQSGQLDGASISLVDLASLYPEVFALELPGVSRAWKELDSVRAALQPDLDAELSRAHLRFGWWENLGLVRLFTNGYTARRPADLARQPFAPWIGGTHDPVILELGSALRMASPAISGRGTVFLGRAEMGASMQFDHVDEQVLWCGTGGAMAFTERALATLPPAVLSVFNQLSDRVAQAQAARVRSLDDSAYAQLAHKVSVVTHTPAEIADWDRLYRRVTQRLANGTLDRDTVNRVLAVRGLPPVP